MSLEAKICGINSPDALEAAVDGGARYVGFVFYAPSPRFITPEQAVMIAAPAPADVKKVGLFVDAEDGAIQATLDACPLDMLQFHGAESPERVMEAKKTFGLPVIKAIKLAGPDDLFRAGDYLGSADMLLFDAKPPDDLEGALPGGNALAFDWELLSGAQWPCPWLLSGGLNTDNLAEAVEITGAGMVDVSSGVEDTPGHKDPARITAFLETVAKIG
ncbi:MAG: phosphoribosylanthranilate isomerase [Proteobacteria bacterium]|nr:phosphoribosylanthranilate isomerase [Pseudomonadota bacterium]MCZ6744482.1 phosphoribosylanthranilate isomerase [Alphaproteobacteria bacterium]